MIITSHMNLTQLGELMGDTATLDEARAMRDLLVEAGHTGRHTSQVAKAEWGQHLCHAVELARAAA